MGRYGSARNDTDRCLAMSGDKTLRTVPAVCREEVMPMVQQGGELLCGFRIALLVWMVVPMRIVIQAALAAGLPVDFLPVLKAVVGIRVGQDIV